MSFQQLVYLLILNIRDLTKKKKKKNPVPNARGQDIGFEDNGTCKLI